MSPSINQSYTKKNKLEISKTKKSIMTDYKALYEAKVVEVEKLKEAIVSQNIRKIKELRGEINQLKAQKLYAAIDGSDFYSNPVRPDCRSRMNVPFILADSALDAKFLSESAAVGLTNLKGHRSVGGMRASIYNAVSEASVDALIDFMNEFERTNG